LREINFGVFEGLKHEVIMKRYADIYREWINDAFKNNIPQAEPMGLFKNRVEKTLRNIVQSNRGKTIAIVCHGGVIGVFVSGILKGRDFWRCVPSPASVTMVEHGKGKPRLRIFNDTAHLKAGDE
jgi:broad specificity phosphatase PhoE